MAQTARARGVRREGFTYRLTTHRGTARTRLEPKRQALAAERAGGPTEEAEDPLRNRPHDPGESGTRTGPHRGHQDRTNSNTQQKGYLI